LSDTTQQAGLFEAMGPVTRLAGERRREELRRKSRATARDVTFDPIENPVQREACRFDFLLFCLTYLRVLFPKPFSADHLKIIAKMQDVVLNGAKQALAAPRGTGKSTIVVAACIWALLYGHRRFLVILCANHQESKARLDAIRMIIETSADLLADFPGPCACVRALGGNYNRSNGQTHRGERTYISWGGDKLLAFPHLPDEPSSGAVIATRSMDGAIRGLAHVTPDGEMLRPDMYLLDDPIDTEQAQNPNQVKKLRDRIDSDVANLGGPGESIAGIYIGTRIVQDDLTSEFTDPHIRPTWRGIRLKLMYAMPTDKKAWETYDDLRAKSLQEREDITLATEYYRANQPAMDAGAEPAWAERFVVEEEISAVQHAMNLRFDLGEDIFNAEYQNEPPAPDDMAITMISSHAVEQSQSGLSRGVCPENTLALVVGADVGKFGLHWVAAAVAERRIVSIVDYGVEAVDSPHGKLNREDRRVMQALANALTGAMHRLNTKFAEEPYTTESGRACPLDWSLIDARWMPDVVQQFCREAQLWHPAYGHGTRRNEPNYSPPQDAVLTSDGAVYYRKKQRPDPVTRQKVTTGGWHLHTDTLKDRVHSGFLLEPSQPGSLALFTPEHRKTHFSFARHITAEHQIEKMPGILTWAPARGRAANHWLDATATLLACLSYLEMTNERLRVDHGSGEPTTHPKGGFRRKRKQRRAPVVTQF
jgi:phage terminase large subunit GpA